MIGWVKAISAFELAIGALGAGPGLDRAGGAGIPSAAVVRPDTDEILQWAASVVELTSLRRQGSLTAKLFGTAGGDPAMNGLYAYLAFFEGSPDEGWTVFRLGDFLSYRVLAEAPGRITLLVRESVLDERSGKIGARTRRLAVTWSPGADGRPPALVRLTPAR